jgi:hypothetical protein
VQAAGKARRGTRWLQRMHRELAPGEERSPWQRRRQRQRRPRGVGVSGVFGGAIAAAGGGGAGVDCVGGAAITYG